MFVVNNVREMLSKDLMTLRQNLEDEIKDKELCHGEVIELRSAIKRCEGEKIELEHILKVARLKISGSS